VGIAFKIRPFFHIPQKDLLENFVCVFLPPRPGKRQPVDHPGILADHGFGILCAQ
jgi:hypothetical protein